MDKQFVREYIWRQEREEQLDSAQSKVAINNTTFYSSKRIYAT